ncbi:MAG TPA: hypothetical protein VFS51_02130 [Gemmatimonadales bacterium]|nr:hypothetical protein [Gemmatimonadales bacterium]
MRRSSGRRFPHAAWLTIALLGGGVIAPPSAHAYIDPQSGSIILQIAAAGVLAAMYSFKRFWLRIGSGLRTVWTRLTAR